MPIHLEILTAARRLCEASDDWTFTLLDIVQTLSHLNESTVRTHVTSRCCVDAPQHHGSKYSYFRRVGRGIYQIEPLFRSNSRKEVALSTTSHMAETTGASIPVSVDELQKALQENLYVADRSLAISIYLALKLRRPLFLEGEAGVGKTEIAKVLASALDTRLIRLQCYEGLDVNQAVYEWNYSRQLLEIRMLEASDRFNESEAEQDLFSEKFLIKRPLLQAIESSDGKPPVLLIDELDRADEEFEGFLLELLSDFQITIPEIGTFRAENPPVVIITSNRTREIHDALKRRCLYYWIDYPDFQKEVQIVTSKAPDAPRKLAEQVTAFVQELRTAELFKVPGVAETLDWTAALVGLDQTELDPSVIDDTLGIMLKYREDVETVRGEQTRALLNQAMNRGARRGGRRG